MFSVASRSAPSLPQFYGQTVTISFPTIWHTHTHSHRQTDNIPRHAIAVGVRLGSIFRTKEISMSVVYLNTWKCFRWRYFSELWIVECFQMQYTTQSAGWQPWKYVVSQVPGVAASASGVSKHKDRTPRCKISHLVRACESRNTRQLLKTHHRAKLNVESTYRSSSCLNPANESSCTYEI